MLSIIPLHDTDLKKKAPYRAYFGEVLSEEAKKVLGYLVAKKFLGFLCTTKMRL